MHAVEETARHIDEIERGDVQGDDRHQPGRLDLQRDAGGHDRHERTADDDGDHDKGAAEQGRRRAPGCFLPVSLGNPRELAGQEEAENDRRGGEELTDGKTEIKDAEISGFEDLRRDNGQQEVERQPRRHDEQQHGGAPNHGLAPRPLAEAAIPGTKELERLVRIVRRHGGTPAW